MCPEFGLPFAPNSPKVRKMTITPQSANMTSFSIFWRCFVSFVKFSYCSKFYSNIITDSGVTVIFFYKGLTRDSEIGKNPSEFCSIYGDWGKLQIPSLVRMSLIKCYWILQNSRVIAFTVSELLRENQEWG